MSDAKRCDSCAAEFSCFNGSAPCRKVPLDAAQAEVTALRAEAKERQRVLEQAIEERASAFSERNWANERHEEAVSEVTALRARVAELEADNTLLEADLRGTKMGVLLVTTVEEHAKLEAERDEWKARAEAAERGLAHFKTEELPVYTTNWKAKTARIEAERDEALKRVSELEADLSRVAANRGELVVSLADTVFERDEWKKKAEEAAASAERMREALTGLEDACAAVASWSEECLDYSDATRVAARAALATPAPAWLKERDRALMLKTVEAATNAALAEYMAGRGVNAAMAVARRTMDEVVP